MSNPKEDIEVLLDLVEKMNPDYEPNEKEQEFLNIFQKKGQEEWHEVHESLKKGEDFIYFKNF